MQTLLSAEELAIRNAEFELAHPADVIRWALEDSGLDRIAIASAFQAEGTVVMHLATQIRPDIPILFLETVSSSRRPWRSRSSSPRRSA